LKYGTPVTGGNVSFYNQTSIDGVEVPVFPTPTIGMIGILEDKDKVMSLNFKEKGDLIFLLGEYKNDISSSEYLASYHGVKESPAPYFDLEKEFALHGMISGLIQEELVNAVHDVADGGLFIALFEMAAPGELGFDVESDAEIRLDAFLFGEGQGRALVTVNEDSEEDFIEYILDKGVNCTLLGHVTKGKLNVNGESYGFIQKAKEIYDNALGNKLEA
jgi:phosphoribosylformylglycinamidine synthase subunit PurL